MLLAFSPAHLDAQQCEEHSAASFWLAIWSDCRRVEELVGV